jgi:hypothetical protein
VVGTGLRAMVFIAEGRSPMEVGRRKKEEALIAMVLAVKNVLTVLAVAIDKIWILKSLLDKLSSLYKRVRNPFSMSEVFSQ